MGRPNVTATPRLLRVQSFLLDMTLLCIPEHSNRSGVLAEQYSRISVMASTTAASQGPQQINVTDLDLPQLADVRRQLEEVRRARSSPFQTV